MTQTPLDTAREVALELMSDGAGAVVLVGSHARGEANLHSDLDLLAIGDGGYDCRLRVLHGSLVSVSNQPLAEFRRDFSNPQRICTAVPGWRDALVLEDPRGVADALVKEARLWRWKPVEGECDTWVAEEVASLAEETHKLRNALASGSRTTAAVQRSLLATRLPQVLAVHRRILYGSENRLWELVSKEMGERWHRAQSAALVLNGESLKESCAAALELYRMAAEEAHSILDARQREVVEKGWSRIIPGLQEARR